MRDIPTSKRPLERPLQEQRPRDHQHNNEYQPRVTVQDTQNIDQHNDFEREKTRKRSGSRKKSVTYSSSEDSRTSDSDSDDSSASDADSFADSKLRNALKSQGQVHDLMLKLERLRARHERYTQQAALTAKRIQNTCRSLERTMRIMADQFCVKAEDPGTPRSGKRKLSVAEPSMSPALQKRSREKSLKSPEPQPYAEVKVDNVKLAASNTLDLLFQIDQKKASMKYERKPRGLLYNVAPKESPLSKLLVSSSIDGHIYLWDSEERGVVNTLDRSKLKIETWAEDMCWVTPNTLSVAVAHSRDQSEQPQMCLLNLKENDKFTTTVQTLDPKPHLKGVSVLASVHNSENSQGATRSIFVSGGYDHGLMLWELNRSDSNSEYVRPIVTPLSTRHTSAIQALHYNSYSQTLYAGGADSKLTWYNLNSASSTTGGDVKFEHDRINHILANQVNPYLLLVCMASKANQMRLYDLRVAHDQALVLSFGCAEPKNTSRYLRPDWKPDSWTVASGNMADHKIHIWDMRYKDVAKGGPSYSWDGHSDRVLRTLFIPGNTMVSIGKDKNTVFTDYQLKSNGQVSGRA